MLNEIACSLLYLLLYIFLYFAFVCDVRLANPKIYCYFSLVAHNWYCASRENWGYSSFMLLSDLNDKSKGFILKDTLIIEVEILVMSVVKYLS